MSDVFEVSFEKSKFDESQFMRLKKGKLWICVSSKALLILAEIKEEINAAVLSKTALVCELTKELKLMVEPSHPLVITFKRSNITVKISQDEWAELMYIIPEKSSGAEEPKASVDEPRAKRQRRETYPKNMWKILVSETRYQVLMLIFKFLMTNSNERKEFLQKNFHKIQVLSKI